MKSKSVTIQMKAIEQYFPVVLFIVLQNNIIKVLTFESVDKIPKCDHSNESYPGSTFVPHCCVCFSMVCTMKFGMFSLSWHVFVVLSALF